jgi:hypothetical protein
MIKKTKNYDLFIFRDDNRAAINQTHIDRLKRSIISRNMLEMRPIIVNEHMEILDGQHRLLAAKELDLEIFYEIQKKLDSTDIILLNVAKKWLTVDYLNYYVKNEYEEYIKLKRFMDSQNITLKTSLGLSIGSRGNSYEDFNNGQYVFNLEEYREHIQDCWETINYIKRMNTYSNYVHSARFWKALIKLKTHANYDRKKWYTNLALMIDKVGPRIDEKGYSNMLMDVYNYQNRNKIDLLD